MAGFEGGDVVFDETAEANDLDGVGTQVFVSMITQGHVEENARQQADNDHTGGGAGEKFEMEMAMTKEPVSGPTGEAGGSCWEGRLGSLLVLAHL